MLPPTGRRGGSWNRRGKGYEPDASHACNVYSLLSGWFEPLEMSIEESRRAREGLIVGG